MFFFKDLGYEFQTTESFNNDISSSSKAISLTFDDGFKNWENLIELFKTHSIEATFFMNSIFLSNTINEKEFKTFLKDTKIIDKEKLINSEIIQKLIDHGHEIGSHTHSHRTLKDLSEEELRYEVKENLKYIYEFGIKPKSFSTPYGMKRLVKNSQIAIFIYY